MTDLNNNIALLQLIHPKTKMKMQSAFAYFPEQTKIYHPSEYDVATDDKVYSILQSYCGFKKVPMDNKCKASISKLGSKVARKTS